jgi:hypothetical protein
MKTLKNEDKNAGEDKRKTPVSGRSDSANRHRTANGGGLKNRLDETIKA